VDLVPVRQITVQSQRVRGIKSLRTVESVPVGRRAFWLCSANVCIYSPRASIRLLLPEQHCHIDVHKGNCVVKGLYLGTGVMALEVPESQEAGAQVRRASIVVGNGTYRCSSASTCMERHSETLDSTDELLDRLSETHECCRTMVRTQAGV
jgi:hypothetical protein